MSEQSSGPAGKLPPRVRIAPSPTGDPHVGTAYIGLFNYVFAKRYGGKFVLRIEDTDQERSSASSERSILDALAWLGLHWDEGPDCGGPFGPYRQSERLEIYAKHCSALVDSGGAYRCFCTRERLEELRKIQQAERRPPGYDRHCRDLDPERSKARAAAGEDHVVRMKVPLSGETVVRDGLRGNVHFENRLIDDQVLMKSDGFPTYHLANVVDDHEMQITHVIRGEEWITSTPKHMLLYQAFGWEAPEFYHLGLLRNADRSKLSKRKNPVSIFHYRDLGYLPGTFLNFLATLGYSAGDDVERFTLDELIERFDIARVSVGGPVFDPVKLDAFNGHDIRAMSIDALRDLILAGPLAADRLTAMLSHAQERIVRLDDFVPYVSFFFGGTLEYDGVREDLCLKRKRPRDEIVEVLGGWLTAIETHASARSFEKTALETFSRDYATARGWKTKELFTLLRIAVTARTAAPPLFDTLALCGKDRVRLRVRHVLEVLSAMPSW